MASGNVPDGDDGGDEQQAECQRAGDSGLATEHGDTDTAEDEDEGAESLGR